MDSTSLSNKPTPARGGARLRIAIAGAGLLGRLLALQLARAGHDVQVFDPAADAGARGAAGWTAAGMLSPVAELESADDQVFAMGLRSLALWPQVLAGLPQPVDLNQRGSLLLAHRGDEGAASRVVDLVRAKAPAEHAPQVLLVGQPTRGVDIGAIEFIHGRLRAMRDAGGAVLVVSSELDEILALADRVIVMNAGRVAGELPIAQCSEAALGRLMGGAH
jgi:glycine/D-amino acid oxidase-like deaminating enzyme